MTVTLTTTQIPAIPDDVADHQFDICRLDKVLLLNLYTVMHYLRTWQTAVFQECRQH